MEHESSFAVVQSARYSRGEIIRRIEETIIKITNERTGSWICRNLPGFRGCSVPAENCGEYVNICAYCLVSVYPIIEAAAGCVVPASYGD